MPKVDGKPKYLKDKRTCVLPVKLEPGHTYILWVNTAEFQNFADEDKHPAVPYLLAFRTKGQSKEPSPPVAFTEETLGSRFDDLWSAMDRQYSYFAIKKEVDWNHQKRLYRPKAIKAKDAKEFVAVLVDMLAPLKDLHVWIETPDGIVPTHKGSYVANWNRAATLKILEERKESGFALVRKTKDEGFGYFLMVNQGKADDENVRRASAAIAQLRAAPGFLVDLRSASGGDEGKAQAIARLFCGKDTVYAKSKYRKGAGHDQFTRSYPRLLKASEEPFTKPVVCLIGPGAVSSGEGFVQMMKCLPQVTTIGLPTRGASGNPRPFELEGLGMSVWFSRWVDLMPNDSPFEGAGIAPDVSVEGEAKQYALSDQTLEKALELLQKKVKKPE
jgi:hypothetical protein